MQPLASATVEPATVEDIPQLCDLLALLFAQETDFTPNRARQEEGLRLILEQPQVGRVFCLRMGERVVGMVSLLFTVSTAEGGHAAWLEDLIVLPSWRGQGFGERLLSHAIAQARAVGCTRLALLTDCTNSPAIRRYERAGFARSQMIPFRLRL